MPRGGSWGPTHDTRELAATSRLVTRLTADAYVSALRSHARGDLLDLGAGKVPLYGAYRDLVDSVTCADWGNSLHASSHLDLLCDLTQPLPLGAATFDTVLLTDVLEHLPNPDLLLGEVSEVLRPGGKVIIGTPFLYWVHEAPHDHHRYTRYRLEALCSSAGLDVVSVSAYGDGVHVVGDIVAKGLSGRLGPLRAPVTVLAGLTARHAASQDSRFPMGYVTIARRT